MKRRSFMQGLSSLPLLGFLGASKAATPAITLSAGPSDFGRLLTPSYRERLESAGYDLGSLQEFRASEVLARRAIYGKSRAITEVLPDVETLQAMTDTLLKAKDNQVRPPVIKTKVFWLSKPDYININVE